MAKFNGYVLTEKGRELLAKGLAGDKIEFTKMQVGDGTSTTDARNMTVLVSPKHDILISNISVKGGRCSLNAVLDNKNITVGFYVKELGVFAKGNDNIEILYAYNVSTNPDFIPPFTANNIVEIEYVDILIVDQATNVTAVIDPSITYVTKEVADETYLNKDKQATETVPGITQIATQAETDTGTNDNKILTPKKFLTKVLSLLTGYIPFSKGYKNQNSTDFVIRANSATVWTPHMLEMSNGDTYTGTFHTNGNRAYYKVPNRNNGNWNEIMDSSDFNNLNTTMNQIVGSYIRDMRLSNFVENIINSSSERNGYILTNVTRNHGGTLDNVRAQFRALQMNRGGNWYNVPFA